MTPARFGKLARSLPEAEEKSHFGKPDFRVRNKIFASRPDKETAVVKLTPDQQNILSAAEPAIFSPVRGWWGLKGWTRVSLAHADEAAVRSVLAMAWRNAAPKSIKS